MAYSGPKRTVKASPARMAALEVGAIVRVRNAFTQEVIAARIDDNASLKPEDRAFATRLALGVASSVGTLDEIIDRCLRAPTDVQDDVRDALRISTYEIIYLDKSPHAAVDQGVELVRAVAPKAAGLANAVLRKIVAARADFPFGDPKTSISALARQYAFPRWLAKRLVADFGFSGARDFMEASNEPAPVFVAVNSLKTDHEEVYAAFAEAGAKLAEVVIALHRVPGCFYLNDAKALRSPQVKRLFSEGKVLVSDAASQMVAYSILPDAKPASVLEIGAGRATKTILLQSDANLLYGSQLELSTLDNHAFKTKLLLERAELYGASVHKAYTGDAMNLGEVVHNKTFDLVFIDAPCSGFGTLRRHPEIRWRLTERDIDSLAKVGTAMLESAASHVAVGGTLAYATCTVTREENLGVVERFLESKAGSSFKLVPICGSERFATKLAPRSYDAHFAVRMVRTR